MALLRLRRRTLPPPAPQAVVLELRPPVEPGEEARERLAA